MIRLNGATEVHIPENTTVIGVLTARDDEGNRIGGYTITAGNEDGIFEVFENKGTGQFEIRVKTGKELDYEALPADRKAYVLTIKATDSLGATSETGQTITINVDPVDEAPSAPVYADAPVVEENTITNDVLVQLNAFDPEGSPFVQFSWADGGNPTGLFAINHAGQITLAPGKTLDYETPGLNTDKEGNRFYIVKVIAFDPAGNTSVAKEVKIYVTDKNDAPVLRSAATSVTISETFRNGDVVATFDVDDVDPGAGFVYEISELLSDLPEDLRGAFEVRAGTKQIIVKDYEKLAVGLAGRNFTLKLIVRDKNGGEGSLSAELIFNVKINDETVGNTAPHSIELNKATEVSVDENTTTIGVLSAKDDQGNSIAGYRIVDGTDADIFEVFDAGGGRFEIRVKEDRELDYEAIAGTKAYVLKIVAIDSLGATTGVPETITINVNPVDEAPTDPTYVQVESAAENTWHDRVLVRMEGADDPEGLGVRYAFAPDGNLTGLFEINDLGEIRLAAGRTLNFEAAGLGEDLDGKFYIVKVVALDAANNPSKTIDVKVYVTDVNEAPELSSRATSVTILESVRNDDVVASFDVFDIDEDEEFVYEISEHPDDLPADLIGAFAVDPRTKQIIVKDYTKLAVGAAGRTFTLKLIVKDKNGNPAGHLTDDLVFTITIDDVPTTNTPSVITVGEAGDGKLNGEGAPDEVGKIVVRRDLAAGVVAVVTATDVDLPGGTKIRYELADDLDDLFHIDPETGLIRIVDVSKLDPATKDYVLLVKVWDGFEFTTQEVTIRVTAIASDPANTPPVIRGIAEAGDGKLDGTGAPEEVGKIVVRMDLAEGAVAKVTADDNEGDPLTYTLGNYYGGLFDITADGTIIVKDMSKLPADSTDYELEVRVFDGRHYTTETVRIRISKVDVAGGNEAAVIRGITEAGDGKLNGEGTPDEVGKIVVRMELAKGVIAKVIADDKENDPLTYTLGDYFNGLFDITSDGTIIVKDVSKLPADSTNYELEVRVHDGHQYTTQKVTVRIAKADVPAGNTAAEIEKIDGAEDGHLVVDAASEHFGKILVDRDVAHGVVAQVVASDDDVGDTLTYSLGEEYKDIFAIDEFGTIRIIDVSKLKAGAFDYKLEVRVFDGHQYTTRDVTIRVDDIDIPNRAPTDVRWVSGTASVREGTSNDIVVAALTATDLDGDPLRFELKDNAGGRFKLVQEDGRWVIKVANSIAIDYEQLSSSAKYYTIQVQAFEDKADGEASAITTLRINARDLSIEFVEEADTSDKIYGGGFNDNLNGGKGDDTLRGGEGNDNLWGGEDNDVFQFQYAPDATTNRDSIKDFRASTTGGENDMIWLNRQFGFSGFKTTENNKVLDAAAFVLGTVATEARAQILYDKSNGRLYYDQDGTGSREKVWFATIENYMGSRADLTAANFWIYSGT
ncbi:cadherin domain-containing protein [Microvirga sp. ACRRW]|nr:cadherin domain-containing protein [Microvirga sp. ACRRW]